MLPSRESGLDLPQNSGAFCCLCRVEHVDQAAGISIADFQARPSARNRNLL